MTFKSKNQDIQCINRVYYNVASDKLIGITGRLQNISSTTQLDILLVTCITDQLFIRTIKPVHLVNIRVMNLNLTKLQVNLRQ